jgi:hypothetical protein
MVGHEYVSVEGDGIYVQRLEEEAKECFPVFIVPEYVPSFVSPACYMIDRTGILDAQWSGHDFFYKIIPRMSIVKI